MFNEEDIRHKALVDASRLAGGVTPLVRLVNERHKSYSKKHQITREQLNNWINRKDNRIPYDRLVDISLITGVHMDCLVPGNPTNKYIMSPQKWLCLKTRVADILVNNAQCLLEIEADRPIIIDTTGMIITGLAKLEAYKVLGSEYITVEVVDLEAILLEIQKANFCHLQTIKNIDLFSSLQLIHIGFRLKQLMGNRKGQRTDLVKQSKKNNLTSDKNEGEPNRVRDEVKWIGTTDERIASKLPKDKQNDELNRVLSHKNLKKYGIHNSGRLKGRTTLDPLSHLNREEIFQYTQQICLQGIPELIQAVKECRISFETAAEIARLFKDKQNEALNQVLSRTLNNVH